MTSREFGQLEARRYFGISSNPIFLPPPPTVKIDRCRFPSLDLLCRRKKKKKGRKNSNSTRNDTTLSFPLYLSIRVFSPSSKIRHRGKTRQGPLTLPGSRLGRVYLRLLDTVAPIGDRKTWNRGGELARLGFIKAPLRGGSVEQSEHRPRDKPCRFMNIARPLTTVANHLSFRGKGTVPSLHIGRDYNSKGRDITMEDVRRGNKMNRLRF